MKYASLLFLLLVCILTIGCGGSSVHAGPSLPNSHTADWASCSGDTCSGHKTTQWGYCQYESHQGQTTFSVQLEIGIAHQQDDPNLADCAIPLAHGGGDVTSIHGTVNYVPFTHNLSSMVVWVYGDCCTETLYAAKMAINNGVAMSLPLEGSSGQPLVYDKPIHAGSVTVWFNDDLPEAKPTTISLGFAGTWK